MMTEIRKWERFKQDPLEVLKRTHGNKLELSLILETVRNSIHRQIHYTQVQIATMLQFC